MFRCYSELASIYTFKERYEYLKLSGKVGADTFGWDRYLNQLLYSQNKRWKSVRDQVIIRDNGCDLGLEGYPIIGYEWKDDKSGKAKRRSGIIVHHMNPITVDDVRELRDIVFDPEFLICVSHRTHEAIHFGDASLLPKDPVVRYPGDTKLW